METFDVTMNFDKKQPKYHQFTNVLLDQITGGDLKKGEKLPSIMEASLHYGISRDTVLRAYKDLYKKGYLTSVYRKGYFVSTPSMCTPRKKALMITSGLNSANFLFYQKLSKFMEDHKVQCDFKIYHDDVERLTHLIDEAAGNYHTFIIAPQQFGAAKILEAFKNKVIKNDIILLNDENFKGESCDRQIRFEIEKDFTAALNALSNRLGKYHSLNLVLPAQEYFPYKLINGFFNYCDEHNVSGNILEELTGVAKGNAYIVIDEKSLFGVLNGVCHDAIEIGRDVGLLSLFERPYLKYLTKKITSLDWFNKKLMKCIVAAVTDNNENRFEAQVKLNVRESI